MAQQHLLEADLVSLEHEADRLLDYLKPSNLSNLVRTKAADFIRNVLAQKLNNVFIVECGSTCSRTYLADSDLDVIVLSQDPGDDMQQLILIFTALCEEIYKKEHNPHSSAGPFTIRNVEFINARTKLINCLVNNIGIDITLNQVAAVSTLIFLEEADKLIGANHLFKQALVLIKVLHILFLFYYSYNEMSFSMHQCVLELVFT
jgi:DNA polymerase sigma